MAATDITTEAIESPNKVTKNIEAFDFFFVLGYMGIAFAFSGLVQGELKIWYMLFSAAMAVFLTMKSFFNKKRRNFESIYFLFGRDMEVYRPVINGKDFEDEEEPGSSQECDDHTAGESIRKGN